MLTLAPRTNIIDTTFTFFMTMTVASTFLTFRFHYDFLVVLETFLAFPLRFLLGSSLRFLRTAAAIAFLPPFALRLAARYLDKHLGLPSPFLLSPHFPMRSPLVL